MDYTQLSYTVSGRRGISYEDALRLWKTKYDTFDNFRKAVITDESMQEFGEHVKSVWDSITPVTSAEAFSYTNIELRRLFFDAIGVERMFREMEPDLVDSQTIEFKNTRYDMDNLPYEEVIRDKYELYKISGMNLFPEETMDWRRSNSDSYAVRCWCTTTGREYWIYVPRWVGERNDAIEAIAWTFMINISKPEYIVRQGDIIIAKASADSVELTTPHHLNKQQYLTLLRSQT